MPNTFIYALCEPGTRTVRYIGKANNPMRRFKQHLRQSSREKTYLGNWIRSVLEVGKTPALVVLREVPFDQWDIAEERYIRLARGLKMRLVNGTDGGDGIKNPSSELREKRRKAATGVKKSPRTLEKMSLLWKGDKNPNFGKTGELHPRFGAGHSEESRSAIRDAKKGENNPQFGKTGKDSLRFGTSHSKESKRQMRLAKEGDRNPNFGKVYTVEERAAISETMKRIWAARKAAQS